MEKEIKTYPSWAFVVALRLLPSKALGLQGVPASWAALVVLQYQNNRDKLSGFFPGDLGHMTIHIGTGVQVKQI